MYSPSSVHQTDSAPTTSTATPIATEPAQGSHAGFPTVPADDATDAPRPAPLPVVPGATDLTVASRRVLSARVFYDESGGRDMSTTITTHLDLSPSGAWSFGSASGNWTVSDITADDWSRWGIEPYGPTHKIVLDGSSRGVGDGPIEASEGGVDYIWVIYHEGPPTIQAPGTIWMKFGGA
jgi:hypothetical protein